MTLSKNEIQFIINNQLFPETLLMEIRGKTISYSAFNKNKTLCQDINKLEENNTINVILLEEKIYNHDLAKLRTQKLQGNCMRARA